MRRRIHMLPLALLALTLGGCGGSSTPATTPVTAATYTVGGTVSGLAGTGLVLRNNGSDALGVSASGAFTFATALTDGSGYSVTIATQPGSPTQTCTSTNNSGTLAGANVTDVAITCTTNSYTIGGTVSGLTGSGLVLRNNGGNDLAISGDGAFTFATALTSGSSYSVTIATQPGSPSQTCIPTNNSGTLAGANVTNVAITCTTSSYTIGGAVSGLTGSGLVLRNNGGNDLAISGDGAFTFTTALTDSSSYSVTIATQPGSPAQTCTPTNNSGTLAGANVTNVAITCTGGGAPPATTLNLGVGIKTFNFSWAASAGATHYKLYEDPDGVSGFSQVGANIAGTSTSVDIAVHRHNWVNAVYMLDACVNASCTASNQVTTTSAMLTAIGYFKASNTGDSDEFGAVLAVSADGATLAIGTSREDSNATGIGGDQTDNSAIDAGAVYVFTRSGTTWTQQAYIKASNAEANDWFGFAVALSDDGNTLAVGAYQEDSNAAGIGGNQADNSAGESGAVYVFTRSGTTWTQQAYIKASNAGDLDTFGYAVALNDNGNTLAVGAINEASNATGINGTEADNSAASAGAVYVFTRSGTTWTQQAYIKASNAEAFDTFGYAVALGDDGNTLAVDANNEASNTTGINGTGADNSAASAGAVYIFTRSGTTWTQQAYIKASNTEAFDTFGTAIALNGDGNTLAAGAFNEDSNSTGINGNQADNSASRAGAVYVFTRSGTTWTQQAYIKASNAEASDRFGVALTLNNNGNTLAVGATDEDSNATGIGGDQTANSIGGAGAAYVFTRSGTTWSQDKYIKAPNTGANDRFGQALTLNSDGATLAISATREDSGAAGIGGTQTDESVLNSGAVYLY
ncbi:MAG: Integrin alpha beta-propellor repeat-containing protein [Gammaproteobacteria bacterium]|nr:MAG: Integrin alpha beta-propellor repeat-containing protein [Gammaproteobacteria bacterium]TND06306.1 MAG: Integrin alpha beta-propellor repeat-containing protein [Gammaproteobacteria bacterium]